MINAENIKDEQKIHSNFVYKVTDLSDRINEQFPDILFDGEICEKKVDTKPSNNDEMLKEYEALYQEAVGCVSGWTGRVCSWEAPDKI